jgi:hypothetical protein
MNLEDIYAQLASAELSNLSVGGDGNGIAKEDYSKLLPHIQMGLTSLHTRFLLRESCLTVERVEGQSSYLLDARYAQSNIGSTTTKYINDYDEPFTDNLFKVERVIGTFDGNDYEIPLNKVGNDAAIRTTTLNTLLLPDDTEKAPWLLESPTLKVFYRADHPTIKDYLANSAPMVTPIYLPQSHLLALMYFIASRVQTPVGMTAGALHEGNNYAAKYEREVQMLKDEGVEVDSDTINLRLERNGWE